MWASNLNMFKFLANKWYFNMLQNMYVSRYVMLAGYAAIWLMDRYLLEQIGSWKNTLFMQKETMISGAYHRDNYLAQVSRPSLVNVHFAARFYTWTIWQWVRGSEFNLVTSNSSYFDLIRSKLTYWKLTLWSSNLFWRALNTGYIPNMIASMLYIILLGFGVFYIFG
jgi:hypothetical protein